MSTGTFSELTKEPASTESSCPESEDALQFGSDDSGYDVPFGQPMVVVTDKERKESREVILFPISKGS